MKRSYWIAALVGMLVLSGCRAGEKAVEAMPSTQQNESPSKAEVVPVDWKRLKPSQVTVSRSQRFGSVYPSALGSFSKPENLQAFVDAFKEAEKMEGKLDIDRPEYDLSFADEDGRETGFHLWLGVKPGNRGLFTYVEDTGTGYKLSEKHSDRLRELIQSLDYAPERAIANGDIVDVHGQLTHKDKWTQFVDQVRQGNPAEVHMTTYTKEGDPIFRDFLYDGQAIQFTYDNKMDAFGIPVRTISFCKNLEQDGSRYTLAKCDREETWFEITVPSGE